jgi:hypothetical protein
MSETNLGLSVVLVHGTGSAADGDEGTAWWQLGGEQKRVDCVGLGIKTPGTGVNYIGIYLSLRMVSTTAVGAYD